MVHLCQLVCQGRWSVCAKSEQMDVQCNFKYPIIVAKSTGVNVCKSGDARTPGYQTWQFIGCAALKATALKSTWKQSCLGEAQALDSFPGASLGTLYDG